MEDKLTVKILPNLINGRFVNLPQDPVPFFERTVSRISFRDREVSPGAIFVALKGSKLDGHDFIPGAFDNGALLAVVTEPEHLNNRPGILVADTRKALSALSGQFYGNPSANLKTVGVTGTNGKTTTTWLIHGIISKLGRNSLRIGTVGIESTDRKISMPNELTTPDPVRLHGLLCSHLLSGGEYAVMEVSSHALTQFRVHDVRFDCAVFTNLTRDHLDYHGDMESYFNAKKCLFMQLCSGGGSSWIVNIDDPFGARLSKEAGDWINIVTYGRSSGARIRVVGYSPDFKGCLINYLVDGAPVTIHFPLIGEFNAMNLAATLGVLNSFGIAPKDLVDVIGTVSLVPGRLQRVESTELGVFVDYAHSPDALLNVLTTLREITKGKLWVIFGCGGDRDKGKRAEMGVVATKYADYTVVTSDNPRTENPGSIIDDILKGCTPRFVEPDRREAIRKTLSDADKGDVILIAGKGHEDYQIIGDRKIHFSDSEVAREILDGIGI